MVFIVKFTFGSAMALESNQEYTGCSAGLNFTITCIRQK